MINGLQGEVMGIDLGGSAIKLGRFGPDGHCRAELTLATPQPATPEAVVAAIVAGINQIDPDRQTRAIILNGQLFVGRQGTAGELGLITLNPDGPPCNSGNRGSLEQYCSVQAIQRTMGMTPAALYDLARAGDQSAIAFWQHYGAWLGAGLTSLIYVLTPEVIILGGGISAAWEFFLPATRLEVEQRVLPSSRQGLQILIAELGNRAGMVGAARLAWQRLRGTTPGNC